MAEPLKSYFGPELELTPPLGTSHVRSDATCPEDYEQAIEILVASLWPEWTIRRL